MHRIPDHMGKSHKGKRILKLVPHARERLKERFGMEVLNSDLVDVDMSVVQMVSHTRSIGYMIVKEKPVKFVYSKSCKKIVTILPMEYDFEVDGWFEYQNCTCKYRVKLFPDCYITTEDPTVLTQFEVLKPQSKTWEACSKSIPMFQTVFNEAWKEYLASRKAMAVRSLFQDAEAMYLS